MSIFRSRGTHVAVIGTILVMMPVFASVQAQVKSTPYTEDAVYVEGLGQGILYSLNYDHRFESDLSVRVGLTAWWLGSSSDGIGVVGLPLTVNYLLGGNGEYLELGLGVVPAIATLRLTLFGQTGEGSQGVVAGTATIGYRYQPNKEGMIFRIGFTPFFGPKMFYPWGGISLGYAF